MVIILHFLICESHLLFYHPIPQYHEKLLQVLTFILAFSALNKPISSGNGITSALYISFVNTLNNKHIPKHRSLCNVIG